MPSRAVIKAAARAATQPPAQAAPSLGYGVSPMMAGYNAYGAPLSYGQPLPRPPEEFATGGFAPLSPIQPMGVDQPEAGEERPEPRRFQYPVAWNLLHQPGTEGLGKLADFGTLRLLADYSSIARACIQLRKAEIRSLAWDIVPTRDAAKDMRGSRGKHEDFAERKAEATKFFKRPDPDKYLDFSAWLDALLEDVFVIDALSVYLQPCRGKGKGLLGSDLGALVHVDGATIRPLVDLHGATPRPPAVAFQQYLYGAPRSDLLTVINGSDLDEMDTPVARYRADQLLYLPMNPRSWSPYGQAPAERCIVPILASLARQKWQADYYQEGTVPSVFVSPGDVNMTPQQMANLQTTLNAIAGDPAWKHKIIVLPGNSRVDPMHSTVLADQFDEIIAVQVCMGYDVMPMELGIAPKVSATQSPGAANQMAKASEKTNQRKSLKPLLKFLKTSIFDMVLQQICGQPDMEWMWEGLEEGEDEEALTAILTQRVNNGLMSHDEARLELGMDPWGLPITADPGVLLAGGFVPLGAIDPTTGLPAGKQPILPEEAAEIPVSGEGWVESEGGGAAAPKPPAPASPAAGAKPTAGTPAHAGAQAAMDEHEQQGPTQAAKPSAGKAVRPAATKGWASADKPLAGGEAADAVCRQLAEDYPEDALGWVKKATWTGPVRVPVENIDTSHRDAWRASHEPAKVDRFKQKIKRKLGKGRPVKPIILVKTPKNTKLIVIDGHHRTLAYDGLGLSAVAWIGRVDSETGPWTTLHGKQLQQDGDPHTDDDTRTSRKAMLSELDALSRHLRKGRDIGTWKRRYLPGATLAILAEDLGKGLTVEQAVTVARSTLPKADDDREGEQQVAKRAHWPAWDVDQELADSFVARIQQVLSSAFSERIGRRIAHAWLNTPAHGQPARAWLQDAEAALADQVSVALKTVLTALWTDAWAVGTVSATAVMAGKSRVDWSKYRPGAAKASGNQPPGPIVDPSLMVYDQQSLQDWLDHYGVDSISSISSTRMDDLAGLLESALEDGDSVDSLSAEIEALGTDASTADMIASTEVARAVSQASMASYEAAGVGQVRWLTAPGACVQCAANEDAGPIRLGDAFPGGVDSAPQHPNCRCAVTASDISGVALPSIEDLKDILGGFTD